MRYFLAILVLFGAVNSAQASDPNRSDFWLRACERDSDKAFTCLGYVIGYVNATKNFKNLNEGLSARGSYTAEERAAVSEIADRSQRLFIGCQPDEVSFGRMADIWMKYMSENPQEHHAHPVLTLSESLIEAFPCNK